MKSKAYLFILVVLPLLSNAQINVRNDSVNNTPVFKPTEYDSLDNFCYKKWNDFANTTDIDVIVKRNDADLKKYIGYSIYFIPILPKDDYRYTYFYYLNKNVKAISKRHC